jgi:hypothetical protein
MHCGVHEDLEVLPVLFEELELEGVGQLVGRDPRLGFGLESPDKQATDFLLDIGVAIGVAQDRQVRWTPSIWSVTT